ncbi:lipopolysaccharide biosynthesis protein [Granulosicoccus sp. 3-233]|uniref:lipopolysaccharide biosynthesis protein n=1 Tax=Granulosicoccus sp. 3-233 TaxID=3417969 RepID=UPI003D32DA97
MAAYLGILPTHPEQVGATTLVDSIEQTPMKTLSQLQRRLLSGSATVMLTRIAAIVVNMALHALLARTLDPSSYGQLIVALNTVIFVSILCIFGLDQSSVRFLAGKYGSSNESDRSQLIKRMAVIWALATTATTILLLTLSRLGLSDWLNLSPQVVPFIIILGALLSMEQNLSAVLRGFHKMLDSSLLNGRTGGVLSKFLWLMVSLVLVIAGQEVSTSTALFYFCGCLLVSSIAGLALVSKVRKEGVRISKNKEVATSEVSTPSDDTKPSSTQMEILGYKTIAASSGSILVSSILIFLTLRMDVWIAGAALPPDDTAIYASVTWLILQTIAPLQILAIAISPSTAQLYSESRLSDLEHMLRTTATVYSTITITFLIFLCLLAGPVLSTIYGDFYAAGAPLLVALAIGQLFNCLTGNSGQALVMAGKEKVNMTVNAISAIVQLALGWYAANNFGALGLAISTSFTISLRSIVIWYLAKLLVGVWTHPTLSPVQAFKNLK